jgi:hypothetical protein
MLIGTTNIQFSVAESQGLSYPGHTSPERKESKTTKHETRDWSAGYASHGEV